MIKIKTIQFKRGKKERLEDVLVGLKKPLQGEPIFELDTNKFKIGDGNKDYKDLPYLGGDSGSAIKAVDLDYENAKIIFTFEDEKISPITCDISAIKTDIETKQAKLTAGENITIEDNVISAKDTVYLAGDGIEIVNELISVDNTIARKVDLEGLASEEWVENQGYLKEHQSLEEYRKASDQDKIDETLATKEEVKKVEEKIPSIEGLATEEYVDNKVADKQDKLTAGSNITIENNVISATIPEIKLVYNSIFDFPSVGNEDTLYILRNGAVYIWKDLHYQLKIVDNAQFYAIIEDGEITVRAERQINAGGANADYNIENFKI